MPAVAAAATREKIPHPDADAIDLATVMRTVGDPLRLDIVRLLADGREMNCQDLQRAVRPARPRPAPTTSGCCARPGVTRTRAEGTQRFISLRRDDLERRFPGLVDVLTR